MSTDLDILNVNRDFILNALIKEGIGTRVHYNAIHNHEYYKNMFGLDVQSFPNAQWISDRTLSLPLSSRLSDKDVDDPTPTGNNLLIPSAILAIGIVIAAIIMNQKNKP